MALDYAWPITSISPMSYDDHKLATPPHYDEAPESAGAVTPEDLRDMVLVERAVDASYKADPSFSPPIASRLTALWSSFVRVARGDLSSLDHAGRDALCRFAAAQIATEATMSDTAPVRDAAVEIWCEARRALRAWATGGEVVS